MRRLAVLLLVLSTGALGLGLGPRAPERAVASEAFVLSDGRFWIDGTSTLNAFTCEAPEVAGFGRIDPRSEPAAVEAEVAIPVRAFDCGVGRMNRDFYAALRAQQHPAIRFALDRAEVIEAGGEGGWTRLRAWGTLTLAGTERPVVVTAEGRRSGDRARVRGATTLQMTDFGIDPPTGLLGLVRAHDEITVRFDLVATATRAN